MQLAAETPVALGLDDVLALADDDRQAVDRLIARSLESDVSLV